ncbi:IS1182 family transposase [Undibacterium macrobrachii]|uniref:IS5/IS1182 family transposase n=1 Tax=Undibacterium macrobrachii TaxID=1119058 RepID=A0ABQ2XBT8_9BURK|nr:IS1182 family transposase [Undibacterium macrobrachii]GGX09677.1 IS5/IS1182 family transposase [Undibacterium macrobrachii]
MARFKVIDRQPRFIPIDLQAQLTPGSFEFALDYLIDQEIDCAAIVARYRNDETGAPAYDPTVMLKIILLAYSRGMNSSRAIERACRENVLFMAISGDSAPQFTTIAKFIRELEKEIAQLFTQVLMICQRQGLIGGQMFAIDGVKLPSNASKQRSGTHAELAHEADRMEKAIKRIMASHQGNDQESSEINKREQKQIRKLQHEASRIRTFLATNAERKSEKGSIRKSNVTDNESAKMATSKGVIQGYTAVAAVDSQDQIIVAAQAHSSGSEQSILLPMIEQTTQVRQRDTVITADAGYHSEANVKALFEQGIPALIADGLMRRRDERFKEQSKYKQLPDPLWNKANPNQERKGLFRPSDFTHLVEENCAICPAGKRLYSNGSHCTVNGRQHHKFTGAKRDCLPCELRQQCLRTPDKTQVRQVAIFHKNQVSPMRYTEAMKQRIDSVEGRKQYSRRLATVEPVFGNLRYNKKLDRFTLRGQKKVNTQWHLYCLVHNIEKLAHHRYAM